MQCGSPKVWRLCRTGGYGQSDASVQVTLMYHTPPTPAPPTPAPAISGDDSLAAKIVFFIITCACAICIVILYKSNSLANNQDLRAAIYVSLYIAYSMLVLGYDPLRVLDLQGVFEQDESWPAIVAVVIVVFFMAMYIRIISDKGPRPYIFTLLLMCFLAFAVVAISQHEHSEWATWSALCVIFAAVVIETVCAWKNAWFPVANCAIAAVLLIVKAAMSSRAYWADHIIMSSLILASFANAALSKTGALVFTPNGTRTSEAVRLVPRARRHNWKRDAKFVLRV